MVVKWPNSKVVIFLLASLYMNQIMTIVVSIQKLQLKVCNRDPIEPTGGGGFECPDYPDHC